MTINATFKIYSEETISERGDKRETTTIVRNASVIAYPCTNDSFESVIKISANKGDYSTSLIVSKENARKLIDEIKEALELSEKD